MKTALCYVVSISLLGATGADAAEPVALNTGEFWGDWVLPSIARSDPAFHKQRYWKGALPAPEAPLRLGE